MLKSYEFIDEFSEDEWALTKSRFNPIKEDFGNTSFFVTNIPDSWSKFQESDKILQANER